MGESQIQIGRLKPDENEIQVEFTVSKRVEKYFLDSTLNFRYDKKIDDVPKSILNIPVVSSLITIGWLSGANIYIDELDETYTQSITKTRSVIEQMYPEFALSELFVKKIVNNDIDNTGYGLLFSGGLDSLTSYIRNKEKKPHLIHCVVRKEYLNVDTNRFKNFAQIEGVPLSIVKSNIYNVVNNLLILAKHDLYWWANVAHAIVFTGLCAPLSIKCNIGTLLIASTYDPEAERKFCLEREGENSKTQIAPSWGSTRTLDESIGWAGCNVVHDGDMTRQDKIGLVLKPYLEQNEKKDHIFESMDLRCAKSKDDISPELCENCMQLGKGTKCMSNILGLSLENIDPNLCGYRIDSETYGVIKKCFLEGLGIRKKSFQSTKGSYLGEKDEMILFGDIQAHISSNLGSLPDGARDFFDWFRNYDLSGYESNVKPSFFPKMLFFTIALHLYPAICEIPNKKLKNRLLKDIADYVYRQSRF